MNFWLGFIAGFAANWVFAVVRRMLAGRFARYKIRVGKAIKVGDTADMQIVCPVYISSAFWSRVFGEPPRAYLCLEVALDGGEPVLGKWVEGNTSIFKLLADGEMMALALVLTKLTGSIIIGGTTGRVLSDGQHTVSIRVTRSLDDVLAAEKTTKIVKSGRDISVVT